MERALGVKLSKGFVVHHINGNKMDNRIENLAVMTCKAHSILHNQKHPLAKNCIVCGKEFTPKPSKRLRAKVCSVECQKIHHQEVVDKRKRSINQYSLQGDLIQTWDSARDIQNKLGFFESNINKCCNGKIHSYKGYRWQYAGSM